MKLTELEPEFTKIVAPGKSYQDVEMLAEAQGIMFLCPKCFERNKGSQGTHYVLVWFRDRGVPDAEKPGPGRWVASGTGYADLTLSPSINLENPQHVGCQWHGFVTNGEAT